MTGGLTSYSGKIMDSVTMLSTDFDSTCSKRFGKELNVESVPLNLTTDPTPDTSECFESPPSVHELGAKAGEVTYP